MSKNRTYPSKIMLVGEYGVLVGGSALTIPFDRYKAIIKKKDDISPDNKEQAELSHLYLGRIYTYISGLPSGSFHASPDRELFAVNKNEFWLDVNIPSGYGIGSSGAVSAAVYENFFPGSEKLTPEQQRDDLALIESFFHGKSSGVDAMTSYARSPLYFRADRSIQKLEHHFPVIRGGYRLFLLDSGVRFETAPLVKLFLERMKNPGFSSSVRTEYMELNQKLIEIFLGLREADAAMLFRAISDFQFTHFREMIPEGMLNTWLEGQISNEYYLKLNGSGGGFMLGITHESSEEVLEDRWKDKLIWI